MTLEDFNSLNINNKRLLRSFKITNPDIVPHKTLFEKPS